MEMIAVEVRIPFPGGEYIHRMMILSWFESIIYVFPDGWAIRQDVKVTEVTDEEIVVQEVIE
jgi:hypothetical protein